MTVFLNVASCQALTMEAASTPETSVNVYQTTRHNIPEDIHLHTHCRKNLKSHLKCYFALAQTTEGAGVAQSVQCLTTDWTTRVRSSTEEDDFSCSLCVQTGSGAHAASCPMGIGGSFPGGKARPGRDADHSPPSSAEVLSISRSYVSSPPCASMSCSGTVLFFYLYLFRQMNITTFLTLVTFCCT
jgi:hypothetical protein